MCLLICKAANKKVCKEDMLRAWKANSNGAGIGYAKNNKLYLDKGYFEFDEFWQSVVKNMELPMIIHFRLASAGIISKDNCHPFKVGTSLLMAHNGTIHIPTDGVKSDTAMLAELLSLFKPQCGINTFLKTQSGSWIMEKFISFWDKVAFLEPNGEFIIFNKTRGVEEEGVWYSNDCYKAKQTMQHFYGTRRKPKHKKRQQRLYSDIFDDCDETGFEYYNNPRYFS